MNIYSPINVSLNYSFDLQPVCVDHKDENFPSDYLIGYSMARPRT